MRSRRCCCSPDAVAYDTTERGDTRAACTARRARNRDGEHGSAGSVVRAMAYVLVVVYVFVMVYTFVVVYVFVVADVYVVV